MHSDKITARQLGEARATHVPASYIAADFAKIDPAAPLPGRRNLFDMNTADGRAAHDAFHAARAEVEASKSAAFERADTLSRVPHMRAEIARIVREGWAAILVSEDGTSRERYHWKSCVAGGRNPRE